MQRCITVRMQSLPSHWLALKHVPNWGSARPSIAPAPHTQANHDHSELPHCLIERGWAYIAARAIAVGSA